MGTRARAVSARMRRIGARVRRVTGHVPLRVPGILFALAALGVLWFANEHADHLLFPAGLIALALLGLCMACTAFASIALRVSLRKGPELTGLAEQIETTHIVRTGFRFTRLALWPLVDVRMTWEEPLGIDVHLDPVGRAFEEVVTARERGRHTRIVRVFVVEDIFGLTAMTVRKVAERAFRVVPARSAQGPDVIVGHASGDAFSHPLGRAEGDMVEMRRYAHGDPMRHVLWKTFARTRRLLVRIPERAVSPMPTTTAFLVAGADDEAAAAAARLYVETGLLGDDFIFSADGAPAPTSEPGEAVEQIVDSIRERGNGGGTLEVFRRNVEPVRLGRCIVFAPPSDGAWCDRLTAFSRALPQPATVIIGVEGDTTEAPKQGLGRWLVGRR
ncbi:MAG TPA: DUF58 domain-containing protein, partial [Kofleriaceae bacterium]|nr:DUF58 domain-containing protein [Kofleriaceae bacterium]